MFPLSWKSRVSLRRKFLHLCGRERGEKETCGLRLSGRYWDLQRGGKVKNVLWHFNGRILLWRLASCSPSWGRQPQTVEKFSSRGPADKARRPDSACRWRCADKVLVTSPRGKYLSGDWSDTWQRARQEKNTNFGWEWDVFWVFLFVSSRPQEDKRINNILLESQQNTTFSDFFSLFFVQAIWLTAGKRKTFSYQLMYFRFGKTWWMDFIWRDNVEHCVQMVAHKYGNTTGLEHRDLPLSKKQNIKPLKNNNYELFFKNILLLLLLQ